MRVSDGTFPNQFFTKNSMVWSIWAENVGNKSYMLVFEFRSKIDFS
jgi:hypothetical protein